MQCVLTDVCVCVVCVCVQAVKVINSPGKGDEYLDKGIAILTLRDWQVCSHMSIYDADLEIEI